MTAVIDKNIHPKVLNHPAGLFVLFFTEMWERFSFYGMRALLVLFLVSAFTDGGWAWSRQDAGELYAWYTALVYLTPLVGGWIADRYTGARAAIIVGGTLMALGHFFLAFETTFMFYLGLAALVVGNGFFKPNIATMVGELYTNPAKKDSAYTIFYMGINAGAFLGIMLCGYVGETVGWSYGFGLAGIFMFFGLLQFIFSKKLFGEVGILTKKVEKQAVAASQKLTKVEKDRIMVIGIMALFVMVFWWAFEQAGSSMTIFAKDYTERVLVGGWATTFVWINFFLTIIPVIVVTYVLGLLIKRTFTIIPLSNIFLTTSFVIIWGIVIWKIFGEFSSTDSIEVPASWFGILNSFFIITLAPLVSKIWDSRLNVNGPVKFAMGLALLGIGFGFLAYGSMGIEDGATVASVSMAWLIIAYLFHTLGELCLSPIGLSYVSKLSPKNLVGIMFGVWFLSSFFGNLVSGYTASRIDTLNESLGLSGFFLLFTLIPLATAVLMLLLSKFLEKRMHGIH